MNRPRLVLGAALAAATLAAPAARADCCATYGPDLGGLAVQSGHALLGYATVDGSAVESGGSEQALGAIARIERTGATTKLPLPGPETTERTVPGLSVGLNGAGAAWLEGTAVKSSPLDATGALTAPSLSAPGPADRNAGPFVAAQPDGSRLVAWVQAGSLHAQRFAAGGAPAGPDVTVTAGLPPAPTVRLVSDLSGAAALLWVTAGGMSAQLIPAGGDAVAGAAVQIAAAAELASSPDRGLLDASSDGAGGVYAAIVTGPAGARQTELRALRPGAAAAVTTVLARPASGLYPSAALSPGGVAFLAKGKAGRADVMVRVLMPAAPPRRALNVSRTSTREIAVDGVALGRNERRVVLYRRAPKGRTRSEVLLRTITTQSAKPGTEVDISRTAKDAETQARLAVATDGTAYVAYITDHELADPDANYTCGQLKVRTLRGTHLSTARVLASCSVGSAI